MAPRPTGVVTFLFTDIEVSNWRREADPELLRRALAAHDDLMRKIVTAHGGWLFKHTGDGICAASSASSATDGSRARVPQ